MIVSYHQINAQNLSINYTQNFLPTYEFKIKDNKLIPESKSQFIVSYTQNLNKSPFVLNFSLATTRRRPPKPPYIIKYPNPPVIGIYAAENNIEWDEATFSNSNTNSIDLLAGIGYVFPHKPGSRFVLSSNIDFGISILNKQSLDFYFQGTKTGILEMVSNQFIVNPYLKLKYSLTNRLGINLGSGYSNIGGFNISSGIIFNPFGDKNCPHLRCCGDCNGPFLKLPKEKL